MKSNWVGLLIILGLTFGTSHLWAASNIDATDHWAWGENTGWLNFYDPNVKDTDDGVTVASNGLTGYIWSENVGWIKLDYDGTPGATNTSNTDWGVNNDGSGNLSGYAWGENVGWINFNPTHSQVVIDSSGDFSGYAWGENVGWICFSGTATDEDETAYKVKTDWSPGGDGGICFIATAAYGTPMAEEVKALSAFRDQYLLTNRPGQTLVRLYYRHSPKMANFIRDKEPLKAIVRTGLKPLVWVADKSIRK